jgi:hypothetical protein
MPVFMFDRPCSRTVSLCALALIATLPAISAAQAPIATAGYTAGAQIGGAHVTAGAHVAAPIGPGAVGAGPQGDRIDNATMFRRGLTIGVAGAGASYTAAKVSGAAGGLVNLGKVGGVPHWGPAVASVPIVGGVAAGGSVIPTTLGQVPVLGAAVKKVPFAGPVVAGPANPILVGAVAVDNYVIPKYSPCGYTKSSIVAANNDFNTPPRLRSYVNYLAPLPYTHPPIYSPSTLKTDLPADVAYIDGIPSHTLNDAATVPDL